MQRSVGSTAAIIIPTGRNSFCCVVPCALMLGLEVGALAAALRLAWLLVRRGAARRRGGADRDGLQFRGSDLTSGPNRER